MKSSKNLARVAVLSLLAFWALNVNADIHVWASSPWPAEPYDAWTNAAHDINTAVDYANTNAPATVLVTNGTYVLSSQQINITSDVTLTSVNGKDVTTVDGNNSVRCFRLNHSNAVIDGFTITNGHDTTEWGGSGVFVYKSGLISNCLISGNSADGHGGGVRLYQGGTMKNCTITGNSAQHGGGVQCFQQGGLVENCTITSNSAQYGGGVRIESSASTVRGCLITGNSASAYGGGISASAFSLVENCTICSNSADNAGGGVQDDASGAYRNNIIYFNSAPSNANHQSAASTYTYSCTTPAVAGDGNITNDPLVVNSAAGNFHLRWMSPCVNTGTNQPWMTGAKDLDGNDRIYRDIVDMGAYEYLPATGTTLTFY